MSNSSFGWGYGFVFEVKGGGGGGGGGGEERASEKGEERTNRENMGELEIYV